MQFIKYLFYAILALIGGKIIFYDLPMAMKTGGAKDYLKNVLIGSAVLGCVFLYAYFMGELF